MTERRARARGTAVAVMLLAACSDQAAFDKVSVSVAIYPVTAAAGDTVQIFVGARNISDDNVTLTFDTNCQLLYRIVAPNGMQIAPPGPWICTQGGTSIALAPGAVADTVFYWVAQVPAGTYRSYGVLGENRAREAGPALLNVQ